MNLSRASDDELRAELARREQAARGFVASDFYFLGITEDAEEDGGDPRFGIVHRTLWHRRHGLYDGHISRHLVVPKGFGEDEESIFAFAGGRDEGARLLAEIGYVELPPDVPHGLMWQDVLFVHHITIAGRRTRVDCIADTRAIHEILKQHRGDHQQFASTEEFRDWITTLAPDLVAGAIDPGAGGFDTWVMERATADALPALPAWLAKYKYM